MKTTNYFDLLSNKDLEKIKSWSNTKEKFDKNTYVHDIFKKQALKNPNNIAIKCLDEQITYEKLDMQSDKIAGYLIKKGILNDTPVALCLDRSIDMVIVILGILKAGGGYVPLDPKYPIDRINYIIKDSNVQFVFTNDNYTRLFDDLNVSTLKLRDTETALVLEKKIDVNEHNLSHIIYTSGSTGNPKGVCITHKNVLALLHWAKKEYPDEYLEGVLCSTSICFDLSVFELFLPLITGGTVVLLENILYINELDKGTKVTLVNTVPSAINELLKVAAIPPTVKIINLAGEPLRKSIVDKLYELPHIEKVYNLYGPSEDTTYSSYFRIPKYFNKAPLIGKPISNTSIFILDEQLRILPPGEVGELYITGEGLSSGYINNVDLTNEKFLSNPFKMLNTHKYIYKTGDIGRFLEDGNIEYLGRKDSQIKIRGHRIELEEIEIVFSQYSIVVDQVVVKAIKLNGLLSICAYVSLKDNVSSELNIKNDLIKYANSKLPKYMIPDYLYIIDEFPLLPNGKIDRKNLPLPTNEPSKTIAGRRSTKVEEIIINIYKDLLNIKKINYLDDFFNLGGHSLQILQIISRVRDIFNIELKISEILNNPIIKDLSQLIHDKTKQKKELLVSFDRNEISKKELDYISSEQNSLWYYNKLNLGSPQFNIVKSFNIKGDINQSRLIHSLTSVIKDHEILKSNFIEVNSIPFTIKKTNYTDFSFLNYSQFNQTESKSLMERLIKQEVAYKFNLAKEQLYRIHLIKVSTNHFNILINMHHIISDRWSIDILLNDILERYHLRSSLDKRVNYQNYVSWQQNFLTSTEATYQKEFWKGKLNGADFLVTLPTDISRPKYKTYNGDSVKVKISGATRDKIKKLSRGYNVTNFTVLLTVFIALITRVSGKNDMVIGIPMSTRNVSEFENMIGYFINVLPMRFNINSDLSFSELLDITKNELFQTLDNKDIPFDLIKDMVNAKVNPSYNNLFQLMFNYYEPPNKRNIHPNIKISEENIESIYSKYDLDFVLEDSETGIEGYIEYNKDIFLRKTIEHFINQYTSMLDSILNNPNIKIDDIRLNDVAFQSIRKLNIPYRDGFIEFNQVGEGNLLLERFNQIKNKFQNKTAIKFKNKSLSYNELDKLSNDIAYKLNDLKINTVGLHFNRDLSIIPSMLGAIKSGVKYIPINPDWPFETIKTIVEDAEISHFITNDSSNTFNEMNVKVINYSSFKHRKSFLPHFEKEKDLEAYILYTSGTTGKPKGVIQSQNNLYKHISNYSNSLKLDNDDKLLLLSSFEFDAAIMDIFGAILNGSTLCIVDIKTTSFIDINKYIEVEGITILHSTPTIYRYLMAYADRKDLNSIRALVLGGEEVKAHDFDLYKNKFPESCYFINGLGPTECTIALQNILNKNDNIEYSNVPIGYPVDGIDVMLINNQKTSEHFGEIVLKGEQIALGYLNDENNKSFDKGKKLYFTGDLARYLPDGALQFLGRKDNQVKIRGIRIDLNQIEQGLLNLEGVTETVVTTIENKNEKNIIAFIKSDLNIEPLEIREELRLILPNYMVPTKIVIVDKFPITNSGKIDYLKLKQISNYKYDAAEEDFQSPIEEKVHEIWKTYIEHENIPLTADLFELGGHSITAMQIFWEINEYYKISIPFHYIFEYSTIRSMSKLIDKFSGKVEL
ncbi:MULTISPECIES: non-ribosomal peptide synthetase [Cytobacillus]|uniref:Carrier domain-containing protein n=1 Tax=Cytobacillus oceanisediminis TaxID=665099 RepID=A0ABX3CK00_9BACI|nr:MULTISPECIES: non-ribosomal peptide synthetase [Cytobacillus]OHX39635.1 hypothetical protein BBV17_29520 [Cytobacillus oceanisediminis]